jgi:hypothetical protein
MNAPDSALLSSILSPAAITANPEYRGKTVGWWKAQRSGMFSEGSFGQTPDMFHRPAAGTNHVAVTPAAPIHVVLHTPNGQVHSQHDVDWHAMPGVPAPSGVPNASNGY